jgi:hypothetical protein
MAKELPSPVNVGGWGRLTEGISIESLKEVVELSGYPFQAVITEAIRNTRHGNVYASQIQQEWAYTDRDSQATRTVDIYAEFQIPQPIVGTAMYTELVTLVECKQSRLPYLFHLQRVTGGSAYILPEIAGLPHPAMTYYAEGNDGKIRPLYTTSMLDAFHVWDFPIFDVPCPMATSFTQVDRGRKTLSLSSASPYTNITLPLMKAVDYLKYVTSSRAHSVTPFSALCRMIIPLVVLRAPMFGVLPEATGTVQVMPVPWVRVWRLEPYKPVSVKHGPSVPARLYDVVHEDYLDNYLQGLLCGFEGLSRRIVDCAKEINDGAVLDPAGEDPARRGPWGPYRRLSPLPNGVRHTSEEPLFSLFRGLSQTTI